MKPVLGYWPIRGLAEPIRQLLRYLGVDYEDKMYEFGKPPNIYNKWFDIKFSMGFDFPNLPYYIEGDFKLTQSSAILEYIADKHNMIPDCKKTRAVLHMLYNDIMDVQTAFGRMCYGFCPANAKELFLADLPKRFANYVKYLGDKDWLMGDKINYPDFVLAETLSILSKWDPQILDDYPKLKAYLHRYENLPALKDYISSNEFKTRAVYTVSALWNGTK